MKYIDQMEENILMDVDKVEKNLQPLQWVRYLCNKNNGLFLYTHDIIKHRVSLLLLQGHVLICVWPVFGRRKQKSSCKLVHQLWRTVMCRLRQSPQDIETDKEPQTIYLFFFYNFIIAQHFTWPFFINLSSLQFLKLNVVRDFFSRIFRISY
jgi:hypothetical protein